MGTRYYAELCFGYSTDSDDGQDAELAQQMVAFYDNGEDWPLETPEPDRKDVDAAFAGLYIQSISTWDTNRYVICISESSFSEDAYSGELQVIEQDKLVAKPEWADRFERAAALFGKTFIHPPQWYFGVNVS